MASAHSGAVTEQTGERGWLTPDLVTFCLACLGVTLAAGFVQVSFGSYAMTLGEVWRAVLDPAVVFNRQAWEAFLLGGDLPEMDQNFHSDRGAIDYETLLDVDPEVVLVRGQEAKDADAFADTVVSYMRDHAVASDLTAVANGDVYQGGPLYQGPITNLVVTERLARDLYDVDEELFDRQRVADVVHGEF